MLKPLITGVNPSRLGMAVNRDVKGKISRKSWRSPNKKPRNVTDSDWLTVAMAFNGFISILQIETRNLFQKTNQAPVEVRIAGLRKPSGYHA
jgi:hypothetical protein